jgi:hypothetical protein
MKLIDERETWIHTHFVADSAFITPKERNLISMRVVPEIKQMGLQYGLHYQETLNGEHAIIVLECIPFEYIKEAIKKLINETIKEFPSRTKESRNVVTKIAVEEPETSRV